MRNDGRSSTQMRPVRITPHYLKNSVGSVLVEFGDTKVLCAVSVEDGVPNWMRSSRSTNGWLTAEYSMLPSSTHSRSKRERNFLGGRTQEIQRLIGRSLRGVVDLRKCPDMTFLIDCDVIQADGGTRCASITGAYVALKLAVNKLLNDGKLKQSPIIDGVAAVSVGIKEDELLMDLDYKEDNKIDTDINIVMTHSKGLLEVQGTAEKRSFSKDQINQVIDLAEESLENLFRIQEIASEGEVADG